ncbi:exo 1,3/1,4-beta-D-glucan glucohydrolase [Stakelama sp. CBK3Z-3]|uniref:Exo 1,3/1,4-beta-D-glucan glucohydrolase n=1 Tax=Stakelama flava TaxID=2860338 RepID=A0ABS6XQA2_9SPHN|nr:exo 1,3/1,4-beta-D-glucan glucohydrolase [Stakelama flava]MBW4331590.1 exo 1,3/1,4-beta-D-glucan glucohydrolase [Stakelama flava]
MLKISLGLAATALLATTTATPAQTPPQATAHPDQWPKISVPQTIVPTVEARIDKIMARMSISDKVGQLIQADIATVKPEDLVTYKLGSVLNGGNSSPGNDELAPPSEWLKTADAYYDASMKRSDGHPKIPMIWGTDAVHGNNNLIGATLFPHNIGLGAARDPELMQEIGQVTAAETAAAGLDWSFAPTLAVVQDDRWGRTYESYSEDPAIVADYAGRVVTGLQGKLGTKAFMAPGHVIATAKHFLGDGGTGGKDQGDARVSEEVLRDIHNAGYPPAIKAGALTIMTSFSSWNGEKMVANKSLVTDVLKKQMGFNGFVVGDWNAHAQVPGCSVTDCPEAINAGLDMFMVSGDWKTLYKNTLAEAKSGKIPMTRLNDAVRRILRVKMLAGVFDAGRPSSRPYAGKFDLIGAPEHRAIARKAVRESLVLLKNNGNILPLNPTGNILVAGEGANDIAQQSGGWSISWQGTDVPPRGFPNAQSIWSGLKQEIESAGGHAQYSADGSFTTKPDAAIVVFGEKPYAEFMGDRPNLEFSPGDKSSLALLKKLKGEGIPVVAVFLSGRPMWVNAEMNASDAFVAAFLPGSEGGGVADVLLAKKDGAPHYDFTGKLSFSWPKRPDQYVLNRRDANYDPLFAFGYGLTYADHRSVPQLDETRPVGMDMGASGPFFTKGRVPMNWTLSLMSDGNAQAVTGNDARTANGALVMTGVDRNAQEDSRRFTWSGPATVRIASPKPLDLRRQTNGELSLVVDYRVDSTPTGKVVIGMGAAGGTTSMVPVTGALKAAKPGQWSSLAIPLRCFENATMTMADVNAPVLLTSQGTLTLSVSKIELASAQVPMNACGGE